MSSNVGDVALKLGWLKGFLQICSDVGVDPK